MHAITQTSFGGPEVLTLTDVSAPAPGPTEVIVRMRATSVNPIELFIRSGAFPLLGEPPFILGWDVSGIVEAPGPGSPSPPPTTTPAPPPTAAPGSSASRQPAAPGTPGKPGA